ncbi:MAG: adenylate/guanylate cyclase domain-containing response regulator [Bacteroidetes bacterium]|nr:adenylate/guanylate cyclase domain-containing response regulator [Bacteroidota bacterium]NCQ11647.1 adenylate/guanylate cyclase domain-containing response regulator [Bacteroidota bacterium]
MADKKISKILIVDDSTTLRAILSSHLSNKGFEILLAKDGHDGYKMYKRYSPDLVISDVNMPVWNGFDLCKIIKFDPNYNNTPIALITSAINQEFLIKSISVCADLFFTRPYQEFVMIEQIEQLLKKGGWKPDYHKIEHIEFDGQKYEVPTDWKHLSDIMLNAYLAVIHQNTLLQKLSSDLSRLNRELNQSKNEIRQILTNTMPEKIVDLLMDKGKVIPKFRDQVSIMFTDFVGFTKSVESMEPAELIRNLNFYFSRFDEIINRYKLEKIKTIGDSYLIASGIPDANKFHALTCLIAAFEILYFIKSLKYNTLGIYYWPIRIGLNSGSIVAGIIGTKRFAYDIWGSNVNIASRVETSATENSVCVSENTLNRIRDFIDYEEIESTATDIQIRVFRIIRWKKEYASEKSELLPSNLITDLLTR